MNKISKRISECMIVLLLLSMIMLFLPWGNIETNIYDKVYDDDEYNQVYYTMDAANMYTVSRELWEVIRLAVDERISASDDDMAPYEVIMDETVSLKFTSSENRVFYCEYIFVALASIGIGLLWALTLLTHSICALRLAKEKGCRIWSLLAFLLASGMIAVYWISASSRWHRMWEIEISFIPFIFWALSFITMIGIWIACRKCKNPIPPVNVEKKSNRKKNIVRILVMIILAAGTTCTVIRAEELTERHGRSAVISYPAVNRIVDEIILWDNNIDQSYDWELQDDFVNLHSYGDVNDRELIFSFRSCYTGNENKDVHVSARVYEKKRGRDGDINEHMNKVDEAYRLYYWSTNSYNSIYPENIDHVSYYGNSTAASDEWLVTHRTFELSDCILELRMFTPLKGSQFWDSYEWQVEEWTGEAFDAICERILD